MIVVCMVSKVGEWGGNEVDRPAITRITHHGVRSAQRASRRDTATHGHRIGVGGGTLKQRAGSTFDHTTQNAVMSVVKNRSYLGGGTPATRSVRPAPRSRRRRPPVRQSARTRARAC